MVDRRFTAASRSALVVIALALLPGGLGSQQPPVPPGPPPGAIPQVPPQIPPRPSRVITPQPFGAPTATVAGELQPGQVIQIFRLKNVRLDQSLQKPMEILTGSSRLAFDDRTNSLIVQTTEDKIPLIKDYLSQVDQPQPPREMKQIRLVWLVGGIADAGKPPPKDLEKVTAELAKLGFDEVKMVAQTLIQTTPNGSFTISSNPTLGKNVPCALRLQGQLRNSGTDSNQVEVQLSAASQIPQRGMPMRPGQPPPPEPEGPRPLNIQTDITTTISAPTGHPVVLCASPAESATSVFVIQVIAPEMP